MNRPDAHHQWILDRCREIQSDPDEHLDLWPRGHFKSSIITFAKTIQDVLNDPELTVGIFSHTRPIAKGFLRQIKREFETNACLRSLFDDILWADPAKQAEVSLDSTTPVLTTRGWKLHGSTTRQIFGSKVSDNCDKIPVYRERRRYGCFR
jgi:hypothetical protein